MAAAPADLRNPPTTPPGRRAAQAPARVGTDGPGPVTIPSHNAAPLTRHHHRIKTHARWASRQTGPAEHVWRTPHGHYRLVNHHGTHPLPDHIAAGFFTTDPLDQALSRLALRQHTGHLHEAIKK